MRAAIGRVSDFVMQDDDGDCRALLLGGDVVEAHDGEAARLLMRAVRGIADSELALVAAVAHARATGYSWRAVGAWRGLPAVRPESRRAGR